MSANLKCSYCIDEVCTNDRCPMVTEFCPVHRHDVCKYADLVCDHSDLEKVIRCNKCKHLKIINDGKVYAKCLKTDFEFLPFGTDTRKHFCGFAEEE